MFNFFPPAPPPVFSWPEHPPKDERPVTIRVLRTMLLPLHGREGMHHVSEGEQATVPKWCLASITGHFEELDPPAAPITDHSAP